MSELRGGSNIGGYPVWHAGNLPFDFTDIAPTATSRGNYNGYLYATKVYGAIYNDYAEYFEREGAVEAGDVVSIGDNGYIKSKYKYDKSVVGVCSDDYFQCIGGKGDGDDDKNYIAIGMAGRVRAKVTGKVRKGDLLVASNIPGVAMRCGLIGRLLKRGCIIGKALESHDGQSIDRIKTLIMNI